MRAHPKKIYNLKMTPCLTVNNILTLPTKDKLQLNCLCIRYEHIVYIYLEIV